MKYPMVVMQGNKSISNVNAKSVKKGDYGRKVVQPLSISETDASFLKEKGLSFEGVLVRKDDVFEDERTVENEYQYIAQNGLKCNCYCQMIGESYGSKWFYKNMTWLRKAEYEGFTG